MSISLLPSIPSPVTAARRLSSRISPEKCVYGSRTVFSPASLGKGHTLAQEVLVEALTIGKMLDGRSLYEFTTAAGLRMAGIQRLRLGRPVVSLTLSYTGSLDGRVQGPVIASVKPGD